MHPGTPREGHTKTISMYRRALFIIVFASSTIAIHGAEPLLASSRERSETLWESPSNLSVQLGGVDGGAALQTNLVKLIASGNGTALLGEAYALKGDADLGGFGAGLIFRHQVPGHLFELNAFFDALQDADGYSYPQLGTGIAYSQNWFTARVNGYLPLRGGNDARRDTHRWHSREVRLSEPMNSVDWSQDVIEHRSAAGGFDAEFEARLPKPPPWIDPHLAVGYFYRAADDRSAVYSGCLVRAELHFARNWSVEAEWRNDAGGIDDEYRFLIRYRIDFGSPIERVAPSGSWESAGMYASAERHPWPAVSRTKAKSEAKRAGSHPIVSPSEAPESPAPPPADCCPDAGSPLVFE
jgi:hypothetical protein